MLHGILVDLVPYGDEFNRKMAEWNNNESRFWSSMGERPIVTRAAMQRDIEEWQRSDAEETGVAFGIRSKDGQALGYMGINHMWPHLRLGILGASIGEPDYWGGGYGTDALLLLVEYAFEVLDLHRVFLGTMSLNARVLRQMEKVGFQLEARRRDGAFAAGAYYDEVLFGMMRAEWPGRAAVIERIGLRAGAASETS